MSKKPKSKRKKEEEEETSFLRELIEEYKTELLVTFLLLVLILWPLTTGIIYT